MMGRFVRVERQVRSPPLRPAPWRAPGYRGNPLLFAPQVEDMEKKLDFLVDMHIQHTEQLQVDSAGAAHMTLEARRPAGNGEMRRLFLDYPEGFPRAACREPVGGAYTERPSVLPISSLQGLAGGVARTPGGRGADTPLSLPSVNHEELERSPSGFSLSGEREGEDAGVPGRARPRPGHLAEGETDTDTDPFTPSGGPLPLSSTGEAFAESVWGEACSPR